MIEKLKYPKKVNYRVSALADKINEIIDLLNAQEVQKKEEWKEDDKYFYISDKYFYIMSDGDISEDTWTNHPTDKERFEFGNIFKTKEEAEKKRDEIKALLKSE